MSLDADAPYPALTALVDGFCDGSVKPSAVTRAHLDRIEKHEDSVGAFQAVYGEDAMQAAEAADKAFASGAFHHHATDRRVGA